MSAQRYRTGDFESHSLGRNSHLVSWWPSRKSRLLSQGELELLASCRSFRSLEKHAEEWLKREASRDFREISSLPLPGWLLRAFRRVGGSAENRAQADDPSRVSQLANKLRVFAQQRLLMEEGEWHDAARTAVEPENHPPNAASIAFATRDRAETLERALASYIESSRRAERSNDFVIIDDSGTPDHAEQNRRAAAALADRQEVSIRYAGPRERGAFAEVLSHTTGIPRPLIHFALSGAPPCPVTTGAAYNLLLLDTIGDLFVMADDDTVCRIAAPPQDDGLRLTSERDPTRMWFFADREAVQREVKFAERDLLELHEELLGRDIGACLPSGPFDAQLDVDSARPRFLRQLAESGGRVVLTSGGIAGDSGIDMTGYLYIDPESRQRLAASREAYVAAVESRQLLRAVTRPTISEGAFCMAGNLGVDNRGLLPPFMPVQRNTEGVFASTLRKIFPNDHLGYVPWAVQHESPGARRQEIDEFFQKSARLRFADILERLIATAPDASYTATRPQALRYLGRYLRELGSRTPEEFEDIVRQLFLQALAQRFQQEEAREDEDLPAFYAAYRERYKEGLKRSLASLEYFTPRDLSPVINAEGLRWLTPRLVRQYGDLLLAWPQVVEGARKLRSQGIRVAIEL